MADKLRIGILSDTHGSSAAFMAALDAMGKVDLLLHAGDHAADARIMAQRTGIPTQYVSGNCDYTLDEEEELELGLCGFRVLLLHGHRHSVKRSVDKLAAYAQEHRADVCIFGHSHVPLILEVDNCLLINPGSPYNPRMGEPTCAVLYLQRGRPPEAEILSCGIRR